MKWLGQLSDGKHTAANITLSDALKVDMKKIYMDTGYTGYFTNQEVFSLVNKILLNRASLTAESLYDMSPLQMEIVQKLSLSLCAFYLAKEKTSGGNTYIDS